jgi:hypothetical protein
MPRIEVPWCAQCARTCTKHAEHRLHRLYSRNPNFEAIGWECRECQRLWRDSEGDVPDRK